MKTLSLVFLFIVGLSLSKVIAQDKIPAKDAANHIGEYVNVLGRVSEVYYSRRGTCFIDIDGDYPDNLFTVVIFKSDIGKFQDLKGYEGKNINVIGTIKDYKGKPEIILKSPTKITVTK